MRLFLTRLSAPVIVLVASALHAPAALAAKKGEVVRISASGVVVERLRGSLRGDEFGSEIGGGDQVPAPGGGFTAGCVYGAPGVGAGRIVFFGCVPDRLAGARLYEIAGEDLAGGPVARFGEATLNLGHQGGDNAVHWVVGAPAGGGDGTLPAVAILHAPTGPYRERLRLVGAGESRFGWELVGLELGGPHSAITVFAVAAPTESRGRRGSAGAVHGIDAASGEILWSLRGSKRRQHLGYSMTARLGSSEDPARLIVGAPGRRDGKTAGRVLVVSSSDGRVLERLAAPAGARLFGFAVALADLNLDGVEDYLVGAPASDTAAGEAAGAVYAFSGVDGSPLWVWAGGAPGQWLGLSIDPMTDLDGDGLPEVAASSLFSRPGHRKDRCGGVEIFSPGADRVLARRLGKRGGDRLGWPLAGCFETCQAGVPRQAEFFVPD